MSNLSNLIVLINSFFTILKVTSIFHYLSGIPWLWIIGGTRGEDTAKNSWRTFTCFSSNVIKKTPFLFDYICFCQVIYASSFFNFDRAKPFGSFLSVLQYFSWSFLPCLVCLPILFFSAVCRIFPIPHSPDFLTLLQGLFSCLTCKDCFTFDNMDNFCDVCAFPIFDNIFLFHHMIFRNNDIPLFYISSENVSNHIRNSVDFGSLFHCSGTSGFL